MTSPAAPPLTRRPSFGGLVLLAVVVAISSFMLGRTTAPEAQLVWETGRADVVGQTVTIQTDSWTYGFEGPIGWIDSTDGLNRGFPECLDVGTVTDLAFASVAVADLGTREVVAIRC